MRRPGSGQEGDDAPQSGSAKRGRQRRAGSHPPLPRWRTHSFAHTDATRREVQAGARSPLGTLAPMASKRQIFVGGVPIGGGAPVAVQTMTKTETANLAATMEQIRKVADAGADIVRVAVPRDEDVEALKTIVKDSPIPVIADIHFNHTLALKAIDAGAHCIRLNPGNIGGREKVAEVAERATAAGVPMRIGVNSGSLPKHLHALERESAGRGAGRRRGRVRRADGGPRLRELQGLDQVDQRAEHDRRQPPAGGEDPLPAAPRHHRGGDQVVGLAQVLGRPRARCSPTGSATRSGSASRPSTPRRRSRSPGRSSRRCSCASAARS